MLFYFSVRYARRVAGHGASPFGGGGKRVKAITNTFVLVASDCPVTTAVVPAATGTAPTAPVIQHELLTAQPYVLDLEALIFETHVRRAGLSPVQDEAQAAAIRAELFAKPHACMRASALPKRYGWSVHYDSRGRLALYPVESAEYRRFAAGEAAGVTVVPAMRSKRPGRA